MKANETISTKNEVFRIISGILGVLTSSNLVVKLLNAKSSIFVYHLYSIAYLAASIMFVVYVFFFYGRKRNPLLRISLSLLLSYHLPFLKSTLSFIFGRSVESSIIVIFFTVQIFPVVFFLVYWLIKRSKHINVVMVLMLVTVMIVYIADILSHLRNIHFNLTFPELLLEGLKVNDYLMYFIPYIFFFLFCSLTYNRTSSTVSNPSTQDE